MKLTEDLKPVTYLKDHTADVLERVHRTSRPVVITQRGEPRAVIIDVASYERLKSGLAMLKAVSRSEEEFARGKGIPLDRAMKQVKRRLRRRSSSRRDA